MKLLVVIDMQNDFINGALGTKEAENIVENVKNKTEKFEGEIVFTRDTHSDDYLETSEGKNLPVKHCIKNTNGWQICPTLEPYRTGKTFDKITFGSVELMEYAKKLNENDKVEEITLVGLCTDICVISNAMLLKAALPETKITVDARCCAGVTPESHKNALSAMKMCQINIINE